jgi:hypothetical protein
MNRRGYYDPVRDRFQSRGYYDPVRDRFQDPFEWQYPFLRIHYIGREEHLLRSHEIWEIRVRNTEDLEEVTREVRKFFESRIPFMETNQHGAPIGDIAVTSSSQDEINILTSYDPSQQQLMDRIESLLRSGFDHINILDLVFRLHLRVGLIARMEATTEKKKGVQDVDGGPQQECLLRAILIHCLKFEECCQVLSLTKRNHNGANAKKVCAELNHPGNSFIHRAYKKLKELIGNRVPIVGQGFLDHITSLFPTIQIAVWFYNRNFIQNLPSCGSEHTDRKKTLHLIYHQQQHHVQIITDCTRYFGGKNKALCDDCCKLYPKRINKHGQQVSQTSFTIERDQYIDTHECQGTCDHEPLDFHFCLGKSKCMGCLRYKHICQHLSKNQPIKDDLKCPSCGMEVLTEQCLRYHLEHSACKPRYTTCPCGFKGNEDNVKRHECGRKYCGRCKTNRPLAHSCYFPVEKKIKYDRQSAPRYFAYDIEAVLNPKEEKKLIQVMEGNEVVELEVAVCLHEINLIVVQEILFKEDSITDEVY